MINHARTLLLNRNGADRPSASFFGEELVPADYSAVTLPSTLLTVRRALFGTDPDDAGMNWMLWQYMRMLHSTEFEADVYALDGRTTYLHTETLTGYPFGPAGNNLDALEFHGEPGLGGSDGRLQESWRIERTAPAVYEVYNYRTQAQQTHYPDRQAGITDYMTFPGHAEYRFRVIEAAVDTGRWEITYTAKPTRELDPVRRAALVGDIGAAANVDLFPGRSPFILYRKLWEQHPHLSYKMSGGLLALVRRTEEVRLGR